MARAATTQELALLRSDNQASSLYVYIHKPVSVLTCQVSTKPTKNDKVTTVAIKNITGTLANVLEGMTCAVGTTPGASDLGFVRVRSINSTTLKIGETSEIPWDVNLYLTVMEDWRIWARKLDFKAGVWDLEGEMKYTDQHSKMNPVPVLGPAFAVLRKTGATVTYQPNGSASWVLDSTITAYSWSAPSASATSNLTTATPTITYNQAGTYRVSLTVTAANGKTSTGHRFVYVYEENAVGITEFTLDNCTGEFDSGGWKFTLTLYDQASFDLVEDQAQVVLFARDWYGNTEQSIGPLPGYENVVAIGRIEGQSINRDPELGTIQFTVQGPAWWMSETSSWPVSVLDSTSTPKDWMHIQTLTVDKGVWHLLYWRSTVMFLLDVYPSGDTRRSFDCSGNLGSLWEQLNAMAEAKIGAKPLCDRYGRLYWEIDPQFVPVANRGSIPVVMEVEKQDWTGDISIDRHTYSLNSLLETAGFCFVGGKWTAVLSRSPGNAMRKMGAMNSRYNLIFADQTQANELTGLVDAKANNPYPNVSISLASNNRLIDIAPRQWVTLSLAEEDTPRGITWTSKRLIPKRVDLKHDPETGIILTSIECEGETSGPAGIPVIPPQPPKYNVQPQPPIGLPDWSLYPTPFSPVLPPQIPADQVLDSCAGNLEAGANGPIILPGRATLTDIDEYPFYARISAHARPANATNPTKFTINGVWQEKVNGVWQDTSDNTWWSIYLIDYNAARVGTGVKDSVQDPYQRTGSFNLPVGVDFGGLEIVINNASPFQPNLITNEIGGAEEITDPGNFVYSYTRAGVKIQWTNYRFGKKMGGAGAMVYFQNDPAVSYYNKGFHIKGEVSYGSDDACVSNIPSWDKWVGSLEWSHLSAAYGVDVDFIWNSLGTPNRIGIAAQINFANGPYPWDPIKHLTGYMFFMITPESARRLILRDILLWNLCASTAEE